MRNKNKLIVAVALLLFSAVLVGSASYAWYSMNLEVDANGMSLKTTAPSNLLISSNGIDGWSNDLTITNNPAGRLYPSSTVDGISFYAISDGNIINGDIGGISGDINEISFQNEALTAVGEEDGYFAEYHLFLKSSGSSDIQLYLESIIIDDLYRYVSGGTLTAGTVVGEDEYFSFDGTAYAPIAAGALPSDTAVFTRYASLDDCMRVAVFDGAVPGLGNLVGIYDAGVLDTVDPVISVASNVATLNGSDVAIPVGETKDESDNDTTRTFTVHPSVVKEITVRVWNEGQNPKCKNRLAVDSFNIGVVFQTKE